MKLDTSSYDPKSPRDDDPQEEIHEVSEVSESHGIPEGHENREIAGDSEPAEPPGPVGQAVTNISHLLSWLLVPLMMPVYGTLLAFGLSILAFTGMGVRIAFVGVVFAFNVLIPSLAVIILKRMGFVRDIGLNDRDERLVPYLICITGLVGTALFMSYKGAPEWLVMFYYGGDRKSVV